VYVISDLSDPRLVSSSYRSDSAAVEALTHLGCDQSRICKSAEESPDDMFFDGEVARVEETKSSSDTSGACKTYMYLPKTVRSIERAIS